MILEDRIITQYVGKEYSMIKPTAQSKATQPFGSQQVPYSTRVKAAAATLPTQEDIAMRAYEIYVEKGCP